MINGSQLYQSITPVTADDAAQQPAYVAFMVAVAGNMVCQGVLPSGLPTGTDVTFTGLTVGTILPFPLALVKSTGTTASLVGLA